MSCQKVVRNTDKLRLQRLLEMYIECAEYSIEKCGALHHIKGAEKLKRRCAAELRFLKSLERTQFGFEESHLRSSNLSHYLGIIHAAEHIADVTQILQAFKCPGRTESMHVDVVAGHGLLWVKVIARKAQALHLIWAGQGQYGERDILLQAEDYAACAAAYPLNFVCPTVVFAFYNGVTTQMAEYLQKKRVTVLGQVVNVSLDVEHKVASLAQENENCHGSEKNDMEACAGAVTVSEDVLKMPKTITVRPNDPDETERVIDVCPQSEVNVPEVDIYGTQANGIERSTSAASLRCDRGQLQANIDKESQPHIIDRTQVHEENDSNSFDNVDGIISVKSNKSSLQVASHQYVNTIHQEYDDIALHHEEITTSKSRAGVSNVNSPLSLQHRHSNQEKLTSNNSANSIKPNYSGSILFEGISFIPETRIVEKFAESTLDENSLTCTPLTEFISSELMSLDMVDYSRLDEILADNDIQTIDNIGKINLDVSSLITLVSAVAHGRCNFRFQEQILSDQAAEERRDPVMPKLLKFMEGKKLYACQTAVASFQAILDLLGGENERARAKSLLEKVTIIPDSPSFRTECLPNTGKIKHRSKIIFGTGDSLQAVTMTANSGFVRAARHQGVLYAVYPHASRALTELKEKMAEYINI